MKEYKEMKEDKEIMRTWIYHKDQEPKIIDQDEFDKHYKEGWRDSPAPFMDVKDCGIDADDAVAVQGLGDTVQGVVDSLNGALNIGEMKKEELIEYAKEHLSLELDGNKRVTSLRKQVREYLANGNS